MRNKLFQVILFLFSASFCRALAPQVDRRRALHVFGSTAAAVVTSPQPSTADEDDFAYERRDRNKNKDALIRDDYWFMAGKTPPRKLDLSLLPADDPTWNAWGTCAKSEATGNSCTYVSLKQKCPAYSKYAFSIGLGRSEFAELGIILKEAARDGPESKAWAKAVSYVDPGRTGSPPSPVVDSQLKMILFATAMLTSPNYSGPSRELLVSRFYVNETAFAINEIRSAIAMKDGKRAQAAWEFGRDSWNSYFVILNRSITAKVGDQFAMI